MPIYKIEWLEAKKPDWYIVSVKDEGGQMTTEVSMNELDKKTGKSAWTDWKNIKPGSTVEGKLWTNPQGKHYLFPVQEDDRSGEAPRKVSNAKGAGAMQYQKAVSESVDMAQARKEHGIKVSSTASGATQILSALIAQGAVNDVESEWYKWRAFLWSAWDNLPESAPF